MRRRTQFGRFVAVAGAVTFFAASAVRDGAAAAQDAASCAQIATAAERLACYDRVLPPAETPTSNGLPAQTQPAGTEAAANSEGAEASGTAAEQPQATSVMVIGMRKYPGRSASFTTDKGDVWIQIGAESVYLPKVPFEAELRPASMGTYFLRPSDYGWRVHVRRND